MHEIEELMAGLDAPAPLPAEVRGRLAGALAAAAGDRPGAAASSAGAGDPGTMLAGLDGPHPLERTHREHLAAALLGATAGDQAGAGSGARRGLAGRGSWLAVAAVLVLIGGTLAVVTQRGGRTTGSARGFAAPNVAPVGAPDAALPQAASGAGSAGSGGSAGALPFIPRVTAGSSAGAGGGAVAAASPSGLGAAPPFAFPQSQPPASPSAGSPASAPAPAADSPAEPRGSSAASPGPAAAPAPVSVIAGDSGEEAGFNAYLAALNQSPSRHIAVVTQGQIATVNLSGSAAPAGQHVPRLETEAVPEGALQAPVYDAASAVVHQGVAAVDDAFPASTTGDIATVYRGAQGIWASDVPNAMVAALRARGVTPVVMSYAPGSFQAGPGAVAFLALGPGDAESWFAEAARAGYAPRLGIVGVSSIVNPALLGSMPNGTRAVGAYDLPGTQEQAALASAIGRPPGMAEVHGWVTAKLLAVALWQSGATTPTQVADALGHLAGYQDGFAPPLAFRKGTTSRTPDGVLYTVKGKAFVTNHAFQTDPG